MGWRRRAGGGKRDLSEPAILEALQAVGRRTWQLSGTGNPDVLVWSPTPFSAAVRGFWLPMEVKTGKGALTANQEDLAWPVIRSVEDALQLIGVKG